MNEIVNHIRWVERKAREEYNELKNQLDEMYEELESYKKCCYEESHNDSELHDLVESELGLHWSYFEDEEGEVTQEQRKAYEDLYNEYYETLESELNNIETFEEAQHSNYLMDSSRSNRYYDELITTGARLEFLLKNLEQFLKHDY